MAHDNLPLEKPCPKCSFRHGPGPCLEIRLEAFGVSAERVAELHRAHKRAQRRIDRIRRLEAMLKPKPRRKVMTRSEIGRLGGKERVRKIRLQKSLTRSEAFDQKQQQPRPRKERRK